jgi:hypothetical protein
VTSENRGQQLPIRREQSLKADIDQLRLELSPIRPWHRAAQGVPEKGADIPEPHIAASGPVQKSQQAPNLLLGRNQRREGRPKHARTRRQ